MVRGIMLRYTRDALIIWIQMHKRRREGLRQFSFWMIWPNHTLDLSPFVGWHSISCRVRHLFHPGADQATHVSLVAQENNLR